VLPYVRSGVQVFYHMRWLAQKISSDDDKGTEGIDDILILSPSASLKIKKKKDFSPFLCQRVDLGADPAGGHRSVGKQHKVEAQSPHDCPTLTFSRGHHEVLGRTGSRLTPRASKGLMLAAILRSSLLQ
jgi:hypothetical protein